MQVGERIGRFRLDRLIGEGTYGVVYAATDISLDMAVAVKVLHPWLIEDPITRERFKRELRLARRVAHPNVCRLFDLHEEPGARLITMDLIDGDSIAAILSRDGRFPPQRAVTILRRICAGLKAAHDAGVIHRDLKPANILLRKHDDPVLLDFGTAIALDVSRVTKPGTVTGSLRFIAPELFRQMPASPSSDIYSLGVVAYLMLTAEWPFDGSGSPVDLLERIEKEKPKRVDAHNPDIPKLLADAVDRAMAKSPGERYPNVSELDAVLATVEEEWARPPPATVVDVPFVVSGSAEGKALEPTLVATAPLGPAGTPPATAPRAVSMEGEAAGFGDGETERVRTRSAIALKRPAGLDMPPHTTPMAPERPPWLVAGGVAAVVIFVAGGGYVLAGRLGFLGDDDGDVVALLVDAGAVDAGVELDAGLESVAVDAGSALVEGDDDDDDAGTKRIRKIPKTNKRKALDEDIAQAKQAMAKKGLVAGDVPKADELLLKARKSNDEKLVADARALIDGQAIDRAFVKKKLQRFNERWTRAARPDLAPKVEPLATDAATKFAGGDFAGANKTLNRAFAVVGGAR